MQIHEIYSAFEIRKPWAAVASCAGNGAWSSGAMEVAVAGDFPDGTFKALAMQHSRLLHH